MARALTPQMHEALRGWVREHVSPTVADAIRILYGGATSQPSPRRDAPQCRPDAPSPHALGSVSMDNCEAISALPDVDGLLVGGAATRLVYAGAPGIKVRTQRSLAVRSCHAACGRCQSARGARCRLGAHARECGPACLRSLSLLPPPASACSCGIIRASSPSWSAALRPRTTPPRAAPARWRRARRAWPLAARASRARSPRRRRLRLGRRASSRKDRQRPHDAA
jgi:hypothetical protein